MKRAGKCPLSEYGCLSGAFLCIPLFDLCNVHGDCNDNSDESDCRVYPKKKTCDEDEFKCVDMEGCIDMGYTCDGIADCNDGSDESLCPENLCDGFECPSGKQVFIALVHIVFFYISPSSCSRVVILQESALMTVFFAMEFLTVVTD